LLALGELRHALHDTPLHQAWLWRETARTAAKISQNAGYRTTYDRLVRDLAGVPVDRIDDYGGVAAGRRIFLHAARLFRAPDAADSVPEPAELFEPILGLEPRIDEEPSLATGGGGNLVADGESDLGALRDLVRVVVSASRLESVPLIGLLQAVRSNRPQQLSPTVTRLAMPLAIYQAGLVPKMVPALLGGRLPLSAAGPMAVATPATPWLARALMALAKEAYGAARRLDDLTRLHQGWHALLAQGRVHRDSRARLVLDLLAATPVLSTSLVARHLGCTPQGAAKILADLVEKGILMLATVPRRWKIFLASDLGVADRDRLGDAAPLSLSEAPPDVDRDAIEATLDGLFADLERLDQRTKATLASNETV